MDTLIAAKRDLTTKAKRLRKEGYITGIVYGKEVKESIPVKMKKTDVAQILKTKTKGSQIMLDVEGQKYDVLIKEIDYNPLKGEVDEIDFQALVSGEKVHSVAEIILLNHEKVTTGILQQKLREISYKAVPEALVDKVEINVENMRIGDSLKVKDLDIAARKDIELLTDLDTTVVMVTEVHGSANTADSEDAAPEA